MSLEKSQLSEPTITSAICLKLIEIMRNHDVIDESAEIILSTPELIQVEEIFNVLAEIMWEVPGNEFWLIRLIVKHTALIAESRKWVLEQLKTGYDPLSYYELLSKNPEYRFDKELIAALKENREGILRAFEEDYAIGSMCESMTAVPLLAEDDVFKDLLITGLQYQFEIEYDIPHILVIPSLRCDKEFMAKLVRVLEEKNSSWLILEHFSLDRFLLRPEPPYRGISAARKRLNHSAKKEGWPVIRAALMEELKDTEWLLSNNEITSDDAEYIKSRFFEIMRMSEFSEWDWDIDQLLRSVEFSDDFEGYCIDLYEFAVNEIEKQLIAGCPSIGLNIETLKSTPAAKLIPLILESRSKKISGASVTVIGNSCVDLTELWQTSYGFDILQAMKMWRFSDISELSKIEQSMAKVGLVLNVRYNQVTHAPLDKSIKKKIDENASYDAIISGLRALQTGHHPDSVDVALDVIEPVNDLKFEYVEEFYERGWIRGATPVPVELAISIIRGLDTERSRKILLDFLRKRWNFDEFNSSRSILYATILDIIGNNYDQRIVEPLLRALEYLSLYVEEDGAPPKHTSDRLDDFLKSAIDILEYYKPVEMISPLLKIYNRILDLEYCDWDRSNAYHARLAVLRGLKIPSYSETETQIAFQILSQKQYFDEDLADILVSKGMQVLPYLIKRILHGTSSEKEVAKEIILENSAIGKDAIISYLDSEMKSITDDERRQLNAFLFAEDLVDASVSEGMQAVPQLVDPILDRTTLEKEAAKGMQAVPQLEEDILDGTTLEKEVAKEIIRKISDTKRDEIISYLDGEREFITDGEREQLDELLKE